MWDEAQGGFTGKQRVTGFPAAIAGKPAASRKINLTGVRAPEECIKGEDYKAMLDELKQSDIHIWRRLLGNQALFSLLIQADARYLDTMCLFCNRDLRDFQIPEIFVIKAKKKSPFVSDRFYCKTSANLRNLPQSTK